nr:MAG TPA: hypothetical protein [Caudoviricetes sp.]
MYSSLYFLRLLSSTFSNSSSLYCFTHFLNVSKVIFVLAANSLLVIPDASNILTIPLLNSSVYCIVLFSDSLALYLMQYLTVITDSFFFV